jgi:hypothetical protein
LVLVPVLLARDFFNFGSASSHRFATRGCHATLTDEAADAANFFGNPTIHDYF